MQKMTYNEVEQMVAMGENITVEFKRTTGELYRGMETGCAFLNSYGGWLLFGVDPNGRVVGQEVTDRTRQEIANSIRKIEPSAEIEVEWVELPEKPGFYVIALHFDRAVSKSGPYSFDGRAFYRVESTTSLMPRSLYEEKIRQSNPYRFSWERMGDPDLTPEDLNLELVYRTVNDGISRNRIPALMMGMRDPLVLLRKMGMADEEGKLRNAAHVLFGKEPALRHPQCMVRLARFEGTDKREFRDQTVCMGNLFVQFDAVIEFCLKHLNLSGRINGKYRHDSLTVPFDVIREAAVNMLCHRAWDASNETPALAIYDDRMVFQNPGTFPEGTHWQDFVDNHNNSIPRNPLIAYAFYNRGLIEGWGRGVHLIMEESRRAGLPSPFYDTRASGVALTIPFKTSLTRRGEASQQHQMPRNGDNSKTITERILDFCREPRSMTEIATMLGVKDRKWIREHYILPLLNTHLELTIPDKPNSRMQKYRAR